MRWDEDNNFSPISREEAQRRRNLRNLRAENRFDKKMGFTKDVPSGKGNLSLKRFAREFLGGLSVTKISQVEPDGGTSISKGHGKYEKIIYEKIQELIFGSVARTKLSNYYTFFLDEEIPTVARCYYADDGTLTMRDKRTYANLLMYNTPAGRTVSSDPILFHAKKFTHNVAGTVRDLYFISTTLYMPKSPYGGWTSFANANPTFGLVTNNKNTQISLNQAVLADLQNINRKVNREHSYVSDPAGNDNWKILGFRESGDCIADYEEIYTKNGVKKVGDLKVGDIVLSYDLEAKEYVYKPITKIWEKGLLQGKRVGLKNGQHIDITDGHPMLVRGSQKGGRKGDKVKYKKTYFKDIDLNRWWRRRLPIATKVPYEVKDIEWLNKDLCFVIGHYLAEGWKENNGSKISTCGHEIVDYIIPILDSQKIPYSIYTSKNGLPCVRFLKSFLKNFLKTLKDNSFDIHLPEEMLHLPEEKIKAILDGFWLGDGHNGNYPQKSGYDCNKQDVYSTSSAQWATDIQRIGLQLGQSFHVWKQKHHGGVGNKPIYRITHNINSHFYTNHGYNGLSEVGIAQKRIKEIGLVKMRDFEVADTHIFVLKNGLICHNCEDFALTKAKELLDLGYPASALHIECGRYTQTTGNPPVTTDGGHAWLVVQTDKGDLALDVNSNKVKANAALKFGGNTFYARRRQIGSNWAFITDYGWLLTAENIPQYIYYYVYDPLLNIFHRTDFVYDRYYFSYGYRDDGWGIPFNCSNGYYFEDGVSINFSEDHESIYWAKQDPGLITKTEIKIGENSITRGEWEHISTEYKGGLVNRDGTISDDPSVFYDPYWFNHPNNPEAPETLSDIYYTCDVVSMDGYYDYNWVKGHEYELTKVKDINNNYSYVVSINTDYVTYYHATIGQELEKYFLRTIAIPSFIESVISPFDEEILSTDGPWTQIYPIPWSNIDLIQGFYWYLYNYDGETETRTEEKHFRIYRNGVDILTSVKECVDTTEEHLLNFIYLPFADRINLTRWQKSRLRALSIL